jgi:hypothetical protein
MQGVIQPQYVGTSVWIARPLTTICSKTAQWYTSSSESGTPSVSGAGIGFWSLDIISTCTGSLTAFVRISTVQKRKWLCVLASSFMMLKCT